LQGIQPIEILSRIPISSSSSVIYKQKFKKFGMRSLCPDVSLTSRRNRRRP
jgi:predicted choloylglycine hydrolase